MYSTFIHFKNGDVKQSKSTYKRAFSALERRKMYFYCVEKDGAIIEEWTDQDYNNFLLGLQKI